MNIQTRATMGDLGRTGLGPKFEDVFNQNNVKYEGAKIASQLFDFVNTDKSVIRTTGITGYSLPVEFEEGSTIPTTTNIKGFETTYSIRDYGRRVVVTDDALQDREKIGDALDEMANLAKAQSVQEFKAAFQILVGGIGTAATSNGVTLHRYNSEALFATNHPRADGGTAQSNLSAGAIALSELNLETGRLALVKQLTDNGLPLVEIATINLVVPDDLEKNARIFTGSSLRASTSNNDLNYYQGRINVVCSRWLNATNGGSATAWYLLARLPGMGNPLRVYRKGGPTFGELPQDSNNGNHTFYVKNRMAVGYSHFLGTWASAGA